MIKGRRVGTFTSGIVMIIFGVLFLLRFIFKNINYSLIISLWPIILILLGIEVIASYISNKDEVLKYDTGAITIVIVLSVFAMGMSVAEFIINNYY